MRGEHALLNFNIVRSTSTSLSKMQQLMVNQFTIILKSQKKLQAYHKSLQVKLGMILIEAGAILHWLHAQLAHENSRCPLIRAATNHTDKLKHFFPSCGTVFPNSAQCADTSKCLKIGKKMVDKILPKAHRQYLMQMLCF